MYLWYYKFLSFRVVAGFAGSFFVWFHRNFVLLRRRYRHYTKKIERKLAPKSSVDVGGHVVLFV